jgi:amidase
MQAGTLLFVLAVPLAAQAAHVSAIDRDLSEVTIPQLERFYETHRYTVTQVVTWYAERIARYDGVYLAIETPNIREALAVAGREDAAAAHDRNLKRPPLWGVPVVIKANTSIEGHVTTDGWSGFVIPGHELRAPKDAPVVAKLKAAGAVIIGATNMPDFAASDTSRSSSFGRTGNAFDVRFSPGGSSGGTVTAVNANFAVFGTGTDTSNSIRMPSSTSSVVGVLPTRGLVSIAGIAPLDWLRDNTGPIARTVTDAAIALGVMAGEDPDDFQTKGSAASAQPGPYTRYLDKGALKGKRFGVPAFIVASAPAQGGGRGSGLQPETRALFMRAVEELKAAGATVIFDDALLPNEFQQATGKAATAPYRLDGVNAFLKNYGPPEYHSAEEYEKAVGTALPPVFTGLPRRRESTAKQEAPAPAPIVQVALASDPKAEENFFAPQRAALVLYEEAMNKFHLDGFVYPAAQMPPPDETMPQNGQLSSGPHSATGWVNRIGVPAVVVPGGFYESGLPFGLELSAARWKDGDLLGWAYAYEQATKHRHPPVLVDRGLLPRIPRKPDANPGSPGSK